MLLHGVGLYVTEGEEDTTRDRQIRGWNSGGDGRLTATEVKKGRTKTVGRTKG